MATMTRSAKAEKGSKKLESQVPEMQEGMNELFLTMLKDIYFAEKQIYKSLPKMAKAAESDELRQALEQHREETAGQIERLEQVFEAIGEKPKGEKCEAIQGILAEGQSSMDEFKGSPVIDLCIVGAGKAVEHYEIARYSSMQLVAEQMGLNTVVKLIAANLSEELHTDELLDEHAENVMAAA